jgi:hypothetical protein
MSQVTTINFFGEPILVTATQLEINGRLEPVLGVVARRLCEQLGLDWSTQHAKLMDDEDNRYRAFKSTVTAGDDKEREVTIIPLSTVNAFLFSINRKNLSDNDMITTRLANGEVVQESKKAKLIRYQDECTTVLYDYWHHGVAMNFRADPKDLDSQKTYDILQTSRKRYDNMFNGLVASIVDGQGKRGADFEQGVKEFGVELDKRVEEVIRTCLGAEELDLNKGLIRKSGEPFLRPVSGHEALSVSILENCVCDLIGLYRRKELGQDAGYEVILQALEDYYHDYLENVAGNVVTMRSTFNRGKGLFAS